MVVGRGYFSHASSPSENVASACRVGISGNFSSKFLDHLLLFSKFRKLFSQQWTGMEYILSWSTNLQDLGPILPYLMHLGSFGVVCGLGVPGENIL